jgi:hypothetical protein
MCSTRLLLLIVSSALVVISASCATPGTPQPVTRSVPADEPLANPFQPPFVIHHLRDCIMRDPRVHRVPRSDDAKLQHEVLTVMVFTVKQGKLVEQFRDTTGGDVFELDGARFSRGDMLVTFESPPGKIVRLGKACGPQGSCTPRPPPPSPPCE